MLFKTTDTFLERMGLTSLDQLPPLAPHLPEASALEAELAGLADRLAPTASTRDDGAMSEQSEIPIADQVNEWTSHDPEPETAVGEPQVEAEDIPDADVLDRLSDGA